jgi:sulfatase modifying factor 1
MGAAGTMQRIMQDKDACCSRAVNLHAAQSLTLGMVRLPGGLFLMGADNFYAEERPQHVREVPGFWIDPTPVTNAQFARFVEATGHVTMAERAGATADAIGSLVFDAPAAAASGQDWRRWWAFRAQSSWRQPEGPDSSIAQRMDHPVVHVCREDALAYAAWAGKQLPTEAQWEYAARGGLIGVDYAWGDVAAPAGAWRANIWQGEFPFENLAFDGWTGTSPVGSFPPNGYGLLDMIGNVWEWTRDVWADDHRAVQCTAMQQPQCCLPHAPPGDDSGQQWFVLKGGSHLCADNYCLRYRPAARIALTADTSTSHVGFRCVIDDVPAGPQPPAPAASR